MQQPANCFYLTVSLARKPSLGWLPLGCTTHAMVIARQPKFTYLLPDRYPGTR